MTIFSDSIKKHAVTINGKKYIPVNILQRSLAYLKNYIGTTADIVEYFKSNGIEVEYKKFSVNRKPVAIVSIDDYKDKIDELYESLKEKHSSNKRNKNRKLIETVDDITDQELEKKIIALFLTGTSYLDIARALDISISDVMDIVTKYSEEIELISRKLKAIRYFISEDHVRKKLHLEK
jgi:hypothetical protein